MRVLLDESLPKRLKNELPNHDVATVTEQNWQSMEDGHLLAAASPLFDVLITADQNLEHQQNLALYDLGLIVLIAYRNRLADYLPIAPQIREAVARIQIGQVVHLDARSIQ